MMISAPRAAFGIGPSSGPPRARAVAMPLRSAFSAACCRSRSIVSRTSRPGTGAGTRRRAALRGCPGRRPSRSACRRGRAASGRTSARCRECPTTSPDFAPGYVSVSLEVGGRHLADRAEDLRRVADVPRHVVRGVVAQRALARCGRRGTARRSPSRRRSAAARRRRSASPARTACGRWRRGCGPRTRPIGVLGPLRERDERRVGARAAAPDLDDRLRLGQRQDLGLPLPPSSCP